MNLKTKVAVLVSCLFLCSFSEGNSLINFAHNLCLRKESRVIPHKAIKNVEMFPRGPHCSDVEVIITKKSNEKVCLDPTAPGWFCRSQLNKNPPKTKLEVL
uniref:Chemokine interleukin-8-like domain-containing protein n=1 Tax=Erpetoichthys calabaricus TaxID=27687 RepID=A0A8C4S6S3_ERPCA